MVAYRNTPNLSCLYVLYLVYLFFFFFYVIKLEGDVLAFTYASLPKLKKFKMYYMRYIVIESTIKYCRTLCNQSFSLQLTVFHDFFNNDFNDFISLSRFIKYFLKNVKGGYIVPRVWSLFLYFDRLTC